MSRHMRAHKACSRLILANSTPPILTHCKPSPTSITSASPSKRVFAGGIYQKRSYAAPRAPRLRRSSGESVYNLNDITIDAFRAVIERIRPTFTNLSPEQYYEGLVKFSQAIEKGSSPWNVRLAGENGVGASTMHEIACILRHFQNVESAQAFSMAMWKSASDMGHRPSTLSLARFLIRSKAWGKLEPLRRVETRFKQLVAEGKDPNALTVEGEFLYEHGKHDAAVKTLQQALRLPSSNFEWKHNCQLCLGKALVKLDRPTEAQRAFEDAVESGSIAANGELGQLLRLSDLGRAQQYLYLAAIDGRPEMFRQLSEVSVEKQSAADNDKSRKQHELWAMEWSRLADTKAAF